VRKFVGSAAFGLVAVPPNHEFTPHSRGRLHHCQLGGVISSKRNAKTARRACLMLLLLVASFAAAPTPVGPTGAIERPGHTATNRRCPSEPTLSTSDCHAAVRHHG
jgi:hypothetical protein